MASTSALTQTPLIQTVNVIMLTAVITAMLHCMDVFVRNKISRLAFLPQVEEIMCLPSHFYSLLFFVYYRMYCVTWTRETECTTTCSKIDWVMKQCYDSNSSFLHFSCASDHHCSVFTLFIIIMIILLTTATPMQQLCLRRRHHQDNQTVHRRYLFFSFSHVTPLQV